MIEGLGPYDDYADSGLKTIGAIPRHSSRLRLYPEHFLRIPLIVPPPDEQVAIVRFLDHASRRIDHFIRAKRKLIALLNEQKQAIIHRAVTCGLDPSIAKKDAGVPWLDKIPAHWHLRRLKDLSPRISGRLVYQPAQYFVDQGTPFLMAHNVTPDGLQWAHTKRIPDSVNQRFAQHALREGDVVTVRVGAPGTSCVVPREADGLNCASLMIIRRSDLFDSRWLARVMNSTLIRYQIRMVQYGAAQEQINIGDAINFRLPVPPREEQTNIANWIDDEIAPVRAATERIEREIALLREYRTRLIADVVTGQLDVRAAAAGLPAAELEEPAPADLDDGAVSGEDPDDLDGGEPA